MTLPLPSPQEHVRSLPDTVDQHRRVHRRLRFTFEPGDLSEIAQERTTRVGMPVTDVRNRVLLLEEDDLLWLFDALAPAVSEIRGRTPAPVSEVRRNAYGSSSSLAMQLDQLPATKP